jgi:phospholipid transport system substrate-binding protein
VCSSDLYARNFAKDEGLQFAVNGEEASSQGTIVKTSLKPKDGAPIPLNYLMRPDDKGQMRITDVYLNGTISELAGRRAEFSGIVRKDGMPALTESLKKKAAAMAQ